MLNLLQAVDNSITMVSWGPEFCTKIAERSCFLVGSAWAVALDESKVIKNDKNEIREYKTIGIHYLHSYAVMAYDRKGDHLKFKCGYNYTLKTPTYVPYNSRIPGQIEKLRNGMESALLVRIAVQGIFHAGKKVY